MEKLVGGDGRHAAGAAHERGGVDRVARAVLAAAGVPPAVGDVGGRADKAAGGVEGEELFLGG